MKREILFRGKTVFNGVFVEGDLIHGVGWKYDRIYILPNVKNLAVLSGCDPLDGYNIISESVGQFTGLIDKNGVKIFEGDILKDCYGYIYRANWKGVLMCDKKRIACDIPRRIKSDFEVIGNIHDNPELLK
jgi:uncharacterized phage protein (TIGR01671 family)